MFGELNARERISYRFNINFFFLSLSFTVMNFDVSLWCDVSVDELFFTFSFEQVRGPVHQLTKRLPYGCLATK